jgi:hypothetical protein
MVNQVANARTAAQFKSGNDVAASQPYFNDDVAGTAIAVQAGPTLLYGFEFHNVTAADAFVLLYNAAVANVTVGTTAPNFVISVDANGVRGGHFAVPMQFNSGLTIASVTATDGSTGAAVDVSLAIA